MDNGFNRVLTEIAKLKIPYNSFVKRDLSFTKLTESPLTNKNVLIKEIINYVQNIKDVFSLEEHDYYDQHFTIELEKKIGSLNQFMEIYSEQNEEVKSLFKMLRENDCEQLHIMKETLQEMNISLKLG